MVRAGEVAGAEAMAGLVHWTETAHARRIWIGLAYLIVPGPVSSIWIDLVPWSRIDPGLWSEPGLVPAASSPAIPLEFCELDLPRAHLA